LTSASLVDGEATSAQPRGFIDRRCERHDDIRDPTFVAVCVERDPGTCVEDFTW
jgi:hypothetical protein